MMKMEQADEKVYRVALISVLPGVTESLASHMLVEHTRSVADEITARRILRQLPQSISVSAEELSTVKSYFETQERFHYQRCFSLLGEEREVWVTLNNPDITPDVFFDLAVGLVSLRTLGEIFRGSVLTLKSGTTLTFDKEP